jgi:sugar O-acyltransferase (sialic acid O-acetyltransferase NeuD family)
MSILLFGSGGHARVLIDSLQLLSVSVTGIFDDNPSGENLFGIPILGKYNSSIYPGEKIIIATGNNTVRKEISERILHTPGIVIHPSAVLSSMASVDEGTVMLAASVVQAGSKVGRHCIINAGAVVDHDCILNDFVHIGPNVTICNNCEIGEGVVIGAGTVLKKNTKIQPWEKINI